MLLQYNIIELHKKTTLKLIVHADWWRRWLPGVVSEATRWTAATAAATVVAVAAAAVHPHGWFFFFSSRRGAAAGTSCCASTTSSTVRRWRITSSRWCRGRSRCASSANTTASSPSPSTSQVRPPPANSLGPLWCHKWSPWPSRQTGFDSTRRGPLVFV